MRSLDMWFAPRLKKRRLAWTIIVDESKCYKEIIRPEIQRALQWCKESLQMYIYYFLPKGYCNRRNQKNWCPHLRTWLSPDTGARTPAASPTYCLDMTAHNIHAKISSPEEKLAIWSASNQSHCSPCQDGLVAIARGQTPRDWSSKTAQVFFQLDRGPAWHRDAFTGKTSCLRPPPLHLKSITWPNTWRP